MSKRHRKVSKPKRVAMAAKPPTCRECHQPLVLHGDLCTECAGNPATDNGWGDYPQQVSDANA